jgi:hypothetical protein
MNSNLRRRPKAVADDLRGSLGRIPLDRVLRRHLDLFEELRREGCTWSQLARALAAAGVRRADGEVVSVDHLRGTVSRQMREKASLLQDPPTKDRAPQRTAVSVGRTRSAPQIGKTAKLRGRKTT